MNKILCILFFIFLNLFFVQSISCPCFENGDKCLDSPECIKRIFIAFYYISTKCSCLVDRFGCEPSKECKEALQSINGLFSNDSFYKLDDYANENQFDTNQNNLLFEKPFDQNIKVHYITVPNVLENSNPIRYGQIVPDNYEEKQKLIEEVVAKVNDLNDPSKRNRLDVDRNGLISGRSNSAILKLLNQNRKQRPNGNYPQYYQSVGIPDRNSYPSSYRTNENPNEY